MIIGGGTSRLPLGQARTFAHLLTVRSSTRSHEDGTARHTKLGERCVMPDLSCPRCGLTVAVPSPEDAIEHCPRCLAQTQGALSITLNSLVSADRGRSPGVIGRLPRRGRSGEAKS